MVPQPALLEPLRRWDPEQIGGYALLGRLGAGSMGRVYLGRSAAGRLVAVKTIKIELADEPHFRTRFAQEVAAARRVSGAFTAPVVAADPEADLPWLATTYVAAPSLSALVRACGPLPAPAVRWLGAGCAEALESIHSVGLVHRDLKPSNVLVSPDGPRVIDFGIARAAERIQLTVSRGAVGTPAYMAPEQARDTRQASLASDVFSLGATMLYAATGHAPYQGETIMDVLVKLATDPPDLSGLPAELADVVCACLQRDPRRRPTSASVLAHLAPGNGDGRELGPSALPNSALALIAEYRRDPQPISELGPEDSFEEVTFGSHPALSIPRQAADRRTARGWVGGADSPGGPGHRRPVPRRGRRTVLMITGAIAAVVIIASAAAIGASLAGRPADRSAGSSAGQLGGTPGSSPSNSGSAGGGPNTNGSSVPLRPGALVPTPPPRLGPGIGRPPPRQHIALDRTTGNSLTQFNVYGYGWPPGVPLTVTLSHPGAETRSQIIYADRMNNFNYEINLNHEFFAHGLPPGDYRVMVAAPQGPVATAYFTVQRS
jgi:serine/threonine protein kinase